MKNFTEKNVMEAWIPRRFFSRGLGTGITLSYIARISNTLHQSISACHHNDTGVYKQLLPFKKPVN